MAALLNARVAIADRFIELSKNGVKPREFRSVLEIYAANTLAGEAILALPNCAVKPLALAMGI